MSENIEKKWQKKWADAKLFESNPDEREKLFLTVAFPYPSGPMAGINQNDIGIVDTHTRLACHIGQNGRHC